MVDGDQLRVATARAESEHAIANLESLHPLTDRRDFPGPLETENLRRSLGRRIQPLTLQEVSAIQRRREDTHEKLSRRRLRIGNLRELELLDTTWFPDLHDTHGTGL